MIENHLSQETLWTHGISGDWPILLLLISSERGLKTLANILAGHLYLRRKGVSVDCVIVNTQPASYLMDLQDAIAATVQASSDQSLVDRPGGVFIRRRTMIPDENWTLIQAVARVQLFCDREKLDWDMLHGLIDPNFDESPLPFTTLHDSQVTGAAGAGVFVPKAIEEPHEEIKQKSEEPFESLDAKDLAELRCFVASRLFFFFFVFQQIGTGTAVGERTPTTTKSALSMGGCPLPPGPTSLPIPKVAS